MLQFYLSYFKKPYSCLLTESTQSLCVLESLDNLSMQVNHSQRLGDRPLKLWTLCKKDGVVQTAHCRLCSAQCRLHMPGCEAPCIYCEGWLTRIGSVTLSSFLAATIQLYPALQTYCLNTLREASSTCWTTRAS